MWKSRWFPRLDAEIFSAVDQNVRLGDVALQSVQKAVVAALSAMAPVGSLLIERGSSDKELDDLSSNIMDALHILVLASNAISARRREQLRPHMQHTYAKHLVKTPEGEGSAKWLFGGNISEAARRCEAAKRISDKVVKRKPNPQQNNNNNSSQHFKAHGQNQNKKFRAANNWQSWQQYPRTPKTFGYNNGYPQVFQVPQQFQSYRPRYSQDGQQQQQQHQQQLSQDFQRKGPCK